MNTLSYNNTLTQLEGSSMHGSIYARPSLKAAYFSSESVEYSTIDGGVITHDDCVDALSNGAGIFIGEYFVGLTEGNTLLSGVPFIKY